MTQDPETEEYMIVMQYASNGNLLSYLDQNINKLTWRKKLEYLENIACNLNNIHHKGLVHCALHGGNIVLNNNHRSYICDVGLSQSASSSQKNLTIRGDVSPFTAPEVFHAYKFTQKSDIYSFGIIMYLMATGELPFRDRQFDSSLIRDIMGGLRPLMPDSAPEEYKQLAQWCCDADPDKRPNAQEIREHIKKVLKSIFNNNLWDTVYHVL